MIVCPKYWAEIGQPVSIERIEETIVEVLEDYNCRCLSFSGGLDSSLVLYFMATIFDKVTAFTIGFPPDHPDIVHSRLVARLFGNVRHEICVPTVGEVEAERQAKPEQNVAVRLLYKYVAERRIAGIVACDGIDEYMGGYYDHQQHPDEITYYKHIRRLRDENLKPLDENSGDIRVYLPYLDSRLLLLLNQIPLSDKVDGKKRKKVMVKLAEGRVPRKIIERWKYGFCDALGIKKARF